MRATECWIERAVIGLNLCPFAASVYRARRMQLIVTPAKTPEALLEDFAAAALALVQADPKALDTMFLIHPQALTDFLEYNEFLSECELCLRGLELEGVLQVASFHPQYQFAGSAPDDVENCTNRSPYPMLHLLREDSVSAAIDAYGDTESITEHNLKTLRQLGSEGWRRLWDVPS